MIREAYRKSGFVSNDPMSAKLQGQDDIIIDAPAGLLWSLIVDSKRLLDWGPPVTGVELIDPVDEPENVGSYRRVDAELNGKTGHFIERRIEQIEGKRMRFVMEDETFGLASLLKDVGSAMEVEALEPGKSRIIFSFYHTPKGIIGHIMNHLVILKQQRPNRLAALKSLKAYAESLT